VEYNDNGNIVVRDIKVAVSSDDAEESGSGSVSLTSSVLDFVYTSNRQTVGMRFTGVNIPKNATILNAYIQFRASGVTSDTTFLTIGGENVDNATTFTTGSKNISLRQRTTAVVSWSPVPWTTSGAAGPDQRTPNIASIIQEVVNRSGWSSGNSVALIITGTGRRVAMSYDGSTTGAPLLHVEYK